MHQEGKWQGKLPSGTQKAIVAATLTTEITRLMQAGGDMLQICSVPSTLLKLPLTLHTS